MTSKPEPVVIDFETEAIQSRPHYPPKPVGFSVMKPGEETSKYYAWGHPEGNNCTFEKAQAVLRKLWDGKQPLLFHHADFDVDVAQTHMGMGPLPWQRIHDTMFLIFLAEPHSKTLSLKPAAERLLDMPSEERDAVKDWVLKNVPEAKASDWGAYICRAPGDLVGEYANGDVIRTRKLFDLLWPKVAEDNMLKCYDRERELMPILLENERQGVKVDLKLLRHDAEIYQAALDKAENYIRERLGVPELNLDAKGDLANALDNSGVVTEWAVTKTGKRSTAKDKMTFDRFNDQNVAMVLAYRSRLKTCLGTFILPWLAMAEASGGKIYTKWNQVRQNNKDEATKGTRTGRLSSSPNFQNIPKDLEEKDDGYEHPTFLDVPELPLMRRYVLPDTKDGVILHRDYNQQELRILAHFEDGLLMERYQEDPTMDIHEFVRQEIKRITGVEYLRAQVKQVNFGIIYGMGYGALAKKIKDTVDTAKRIKTAQRRALPGMANLEKEVKRIGGNGQHITTWGGRHYYCEPPMVKDGRTITFEYKLLNYLIQGSAADVTKQAIIEYDKAKKHGRFIITVHDEINIVCPKKHAKEEMAILRKVMESIPLDVPLLSDGKIGPNWGEMEKFKEPEWSR